MKITALIITSAISFSLFSQTKKDILIEKQNVFDSLKIESVKQFNSNKYKSDSLISLLVKKNSTFQEEKNRNTASISKIHLYKDSITYIQKNNSRNTTRLDSINRELLIINDSISSNPKLILVGNQIWMAENLTIKKFNNGELIYNANSNIDWIKCAENKTPAFCIKINFNGDSLFLYNWYAVNDKRGLLPKGIYVPTNEDLIELENSLGALVGPMLKKSNSWKNSLATNDYEFGAIPSFIRDEKGQFYENTFGIWSSSEESTNSAIGFMLDDVVDFPHREGFDKNEGFLIRGIKK